MVVQLALFCFKFILMMYLRCDPCFDFYKVWLLEFLGVERVCSGGWSKDLSQAPGLYMFEIIRPKCVWHNIKGFFCGIDA